VGEVVKLSFMRARAWLLGVLLTVGCSSEAVNQTSQADPGAPADPTPAATDTSAAPAVAGDFAPMAAYPAGPYGHGVGAVIDNLEFLGWRDPIAANYDVTKLEHIRLADFYDPSGTQTELIVLNASAVWCTVCQAELHDMQKNGTYQAFRQRKAEVFGTLFQDGSGDPAKPSDLSLWGSSKARAIDFPLVLDPALKMGPYFPGDATPLNLVIDATTMKIIDVMLGYDPSPGTGLWGVVDQELATRGL
jgi:hypothetical protein